MELVVHPDERSAAQRTDGDRVQIRIEDVAKLVFARAQRIGHPPDERGDDRDVRGHERGNAEPCGKPAEALRGRPRAVEQDEQQDGGGEDPSHHRPRGTPVDRYRHGPAVGERAHRAEAEEEQREARQRCHRGVEALDSEHGVGAQHRAERAEQSEEDSRSRERLSDQRPSADDEDHQRGSDQQQAARGRTRHRRSGKEVTADAGINPEDVVHQGCRAH